MGVSDSTPGRPGDLAPELLDRYVIGAAGSDDRAIVEAWIGDDLERRQAIEALVRFRQERRALAVDRSEVEAMRAAFVAARAASHAKKIARLVPRETQSSVWSWARIAAAVLIMAAGTVVLWRSGWLAPGQPLRELTSARGSITTITLRDGTRLTLGPATRLRIPRHFGVRTRTVELDGEALFVVVHDAGHPFVVRTPLTVVHDIGTTFVVHAYGADPVERVTVAEGEVAVGGVSLKARDGASVDATGRVTVRRSIDLAGDLAWMQHGLAFKDTPLRDVARELSRAYEVDVVIADSTLSDKLVTASFNDAPVDVVLRAVTFSVGAHYERTGRSVVIHRGVVPAANQPDRRAADTGMRFAHARVVRNMDGNE